MQYLKNQYVTAIKIAKNYQYMGPDQGLYIAEYEGFYPQIFFLIFNFLIFAQEMIMLINFNIV